MQGLATDLKSVGVPTDLAGSLKFTPTFLAAVGKDLDHDRQLAQELGVSAHFARPRRPAVGLGPGQAQPFRANAQMFELMGQGIGSQSPEQVGQQLESLKESTRISYRLTTGQQPT